MLVMQCCPTSFAAMADTMDVLRTVDEMMVKISSLVGGNPDWHQSEPLTVSFKKVSALETVRNLWEKVSQHQQLLGSCCTIHLLSVCSKLVKC